MLQSFHSIPSPSCIDDTKSEKIHPIGIQLHLAFFPILQVISLHSSSFVYHTPIVTKVFLLPGGSVYQPSDTFPYTEETIPHTPQTKGQFDFPTSFPIRSIFEISPVIIVFPLLPFLLGFYVEIPTTVQEGIRPDFGTVFPLPNLHFLHN